ncbi:MAG: hypothetical protein ACTHK1_04205 [Actinomycetales bacterium]
MTASLTTTDARPATSAPLRRFLLRRWPTWTALAATASGVALLSLLPARLRLDVGAWSVLLAAVIYLAWGAARDSTRDPAWRRAQTGGVLAFGALAITVAAADLPVARYVLAAGWLGHAAWDAVHHRHDRVVPRWYAELCMAADLTIAAALVSGLAIA